MCGRTPHPVPRLRKVMERGCCGLRREHDVSAERVSVWGERMKERETEEEIEKKKGVSALS